MIETFATTIALVVGAGLLGGALAGLLALLVDPD